MFLLLPSSAGLSKGASSPYVANHPNLEKRMMFMQSNPEDDFGAFLLMDNALTRQEDIKKYVEMGYFVRTRADIETYEA